MALLMSAPSGSAQAIQAQHGIGSGEGYNKPSAPYVARTPYTLRWTAESRYKIYGKQDPTVIGRDNWTSATVRDAETGKIICSSPRFGMTGELKVPVSGKHVVSIIALGKWTADFTEDAAMLKKAASRGELKNGVTIDEAKLSSLRTKNETIETRKAALLAQISEERGFIGEEAARLLSADAVKAAHLASSEADFDQRFNALRAETMKKITQAETALDPKKNIPASTWNGKGLPPGMQPRK